VKVVPGHWITDGARMLGEGREPGCWQVDGLEVSDGAQEELAARRRFYSWGSNSPMRAWGGGLHTQQHVGQGARSAINTHSQNAVMYSDANCTGSWAYVPGNTGLNTLPFVPKSVYIY